MQEQPYFERGLNASKPCFDGKHKDCGMTSCSCSCRPPKTWTCLANVRSGGGCGQVFYSSLLFAQHQDMHRRNASFDERCYELAEHFLEDELDTEENCRRLAIVIQQAIEEELADIELEAL